MTRDLATVAGIVESANAILKYVDGVTEEESLEDVRLGDAVIRRIEVIGEAAGRLSAAFREERAGIPRREIRGVRNRMIHVYDDIDMNLVWRDCPERHPWSSRRARAFGVRGSGRRPKRLKKAACR